MEQLLEQRLAAEARALRQTHVPGFGRDFRPSLRATRGQAPSMSRVSCLRSPGLGREIHALSSAEKDAALLAIHHPALWDLHEQRPLPALPTYHPLQSHPVATGIQLPALSGTLAIAERIGVLALHPKRLIGGRESDDAGAPDGFGEADERPAPYLAPVEWIGDLLLFMLDADGPYLVYWDVKAKSGDHTLPGPRPDQRAASERAMRKAAARHRVQQLHFEQAGIRTISVTRAAIDRQLANNLRFLFGWSLQPPSMSEVDRQRVVDRLRIAQLSGEPPINALVKLSADGGFSIEDAKRVLYQSIWARTLRVDLYKPVLIDRPLRPETRDVVDEYAEWFRR